jgi:hypothetical protein
LDDSQFDESSDEEPFTKDEIADYAKAYTKATGDPPTAPFHWRVWDINEETGEIKRKVSVCVIPLPVF